jgi:ABC-type multidrug transport system ATPase subunit
LTTQYLEEADRLAKHLVVLDHGKIIAEGSSQQLKSQMGATVLALTFTSSDDAHNAQPLLADLAAKTPNIDGSILELTVENGPATTADALRRLDAAHITVGGLVLREPSLDDVFLNLTGHKAEDDNVDDGPSTGRRGRKAHA